MYLIFTTQYLQVLVDNWLKFKECHVSKFNLAIICSCLCHKEIWYIQVRKLIGKYHNDIIIDKNINQNYIAKFKPKKNVGDYIFFHTSWTETLRWSEKNPNVNGTWCIAYPYPFVERAYFKIGFVARISCVNFLYILLTKKYLT